MPTSRVFNFELVNFGSPTDGHKIEGAVAAYLVDATDPVLDAPGERDFLEAPFSFVAKMLDNCQSFINGTWQGSYDFRDFRLCFENRADGVAVRLWPTGFGSPPATWSLPNMSNDWIWNVDGIRN